jgi:hypothetical protein
MAVSKRKFYRRVIQFEILSEEPIGDPSLAVIAEECMNGDLNGHFLMDAVPEEVIDGKTCATKLAASGSDPEFFQLDKDGNDLDAEDAVTIYDLMADRTGTKREDWEDIDGPDSGVGVDYWHRTKDGQWEAYVNIDQEYVTVEIKSLVNADADPIKFRGTYEELGFEPSEA